MKRTMDEIARRYRAWVKYPNASLEHLEERQRLWELYCDARDGLPDGTTASREPQFHGDIEDGERVPHRRNLTVVRS